MKRTFTATALLLGTALALMGCRTTAAITIASARGFSESKRVTLEGFVTVPPGAFNSAKPDQGFAAQDDSAGIYVSVVPKLDLAVGQKVRVTGAMSKTHQLRIILADAVTINPAGPRVIEPKVVKTSEVNAAAEGLLVRVAGRVTRPIVDDSPYGYKLYLDDGSGAIQVFLHSSAGFDASKNAAYTPGTQLTVTGFAGRYDAEFEVDPRTVGDVGQ